MLGFYTFSNAQQKNDECKEYIYNYVKKMASMSVPSGKNVYFLDVNITSVYNCSAKLNPTTTNIKVEKSADILYYDSDLMSLYIDKKNSYMVLRKQKMIIKGFSNIGNDKDNVDNTIKLQDTLIKTCLVIKCEEANIKGEKYKIVYMKPLKSISDKYHIKYASYKYSLSKEMLKEVNIYFEDTENIIQQTTIYNTVDFNYKKKVSLNAYSKIFTSTGSFQKKFYGYEFIDNTKNIK